MKKFRQLTLLIITIISVILLLIYRHEYLKLRYVLEVLNFFGEPTKFTTPNPTETDGTIQITYWQEINNNLRSFSAIYDNENSNVNVLALGVPFKNKNCYFHTENSLDIGKFSYKLIKTINNFNILTLSCKTTSFKTPYAISFQNTNLIVVNQPEEVNLTLCISPIYRYLDKKDLINFFTFYHYKLNINNFIYYSNNYIPISTLSKFKYLLNIKNIKLDIVLWNLPRTYSDIEEELIKIDCLNRNKNMLLVKFYEYLMPMNNFEEIWYKKRMNLVVIKDVLVVNDKELLENTNYFKNRNEYFVLHKNIENNYDNDQVISDTSMTMYRYSEHKKDTINEYKTDSRVLKCLHDVLKESKLKLFLEKYL